MTPRRLLLVPCALLLLLLACSGGSDPLVIRSGHITGTVSTPAGGTTPASVPLKDAVVVHSDGDGRDDTLRTDTAGHFDLSVPEGTHRLMIAKPGFRTVEMTATVKADETVTLASPGHGGIFVQPAAQKPARWTVMYYLAANNDLVGDVERFWHGVHTQVRMLRGMYDLVQGPFSTALKEDIDIVIFYDQPSVNTGEPSSPAYKDSPYYYKPGTYVIHLRNVNGKTVMDSRAWDGAGTDSGSVGTFKEFGQMVLNDYPADHYMLVMWDHGFGINGLCKNDKLHTRIFLHEFSAALKELTAAQPFEIVAFDACLMAMFEVAYELGSCNVNYMVAGETLLLAYNLPTCGMYVYFDPTHHPYEAQGDSQMIKWLTEITARTPKETARLLAYETDAAQWEYWLTETDDGYEPQGGREAYVSVDLKAFMAQEGPAGRFKALARKLNGNRDELGPKVGEAKLKTQNMSGSANDRGFLDDPYFEDNNYRDLKHFCLNMSALSPASKAETDSLAKSLDCASLSDRNPAAAILYYSQLKPPAGGFFGLSTLLTTAYGTTSSTYYEPQYQKLQIFRDCPDMWAFLLATRP